MYLIHAMYSSKEANDMKLYVTEVFINTTKTTNYSESRTKLKRLALIFFGDILEGPRIFHCIISTVACIGGALIFFL